MAETEQASEDIGLAKKRAEILRLVAERNEALAKATEITCPLARAGLLAAGQLIDSQIGRVESTPAKEFV
ncbi:MAG TPA: hypothetical protein VGK73_09030 [Polyangiaceae bacterium]